VKKGDKFMIINNKYIELGFFEKEKNEYIFIFTFNVDEFSLRKRKKSNFTSYPIRDETFILLLKDMYNYDFKEE